jgi:hypothetical protein
MSDLFAGLEPLPPAPLAIPRKGGADPMLGESGHARNDKDFYSTEEWVTRLLMARYNLRGPIWEPACGDGRMTRVLAQRFDVVSSDLVDRGFSDWVQLDFLRASEPPGGREVGAIVTNPPYGERGLLAREFVCKALALMRPVGGQVAMFLRNEWDCAVTWRELYEIMPLALKIVCLRRPYWAERRAGDSGPRHNFAWFVWDWQATELRRMAWGP